MHLQHPRRGKKLFIIFSSGKFAPQILAYSASYVAKAKNVAVFKNVSMASGHIATSCFYGSLIIKAICDFTADNKNKK